MTELNPSSPAANDHIVDLVSTALKQDKRSGLLRMLESIGMALRADGCMIWEATPTTSLKKNAGQRRLLVLDEWTADGHVNNFYDLPLESGAGWVVLHEQPRNVPDARTDTQISLPHANQIGARSLLILPIFFSDNSRTAALTLYRGTLAPFSQAEEAEAKQLALLLPDLYQTIRAKMGFNLMRSIRDELQRAKPRLSQQASLAAMLKGVLQSVCNLVGDTFEAVETSIFLEEPRTLPRIYRVAATTWTGMFRKRVYRSIEKEKCLTAWVIANRRSVKLFDLARFERDRGAIKETYPGINWADSLDFKSTIRRRLNLTSTDESPPLSFMASPIMVGDKILGIIRCCTAQSGPRYFGERDLELLDLVAAQIGQYWSKWLSELEIQKENQSWHELVERIGQLNQFALNELNRESLEEKAIFAEALEVARSTITEADTLDVRLFNPRTRQLYFAKTLGDAWQAGSQSEIDARHQVTYDVDNRPAQSIGENVFQTGTVQLITRPSQSPHYAGKVNFPAVKRMIVAPIKVADKTLGVLDILSTQNRKFPGNAERIAELLGQQIGLYQYMADAIKNRRRAELDLRDEIKERNRILEDLSHQVKTPINQAFARTRRLLENEVDEKRIYRLQAIRGLCGKAKRVSMSMKLLATLARKEPIKLKLENLYLDLLMRILIEAASDSRLLVEPGRRIKTEVKRETFNPREISQVRVDFDLLEQAVGNILDNACKYSYENTVVQIYGGVTRNGRFHISVINEGLPISAKDLSHCIERGWRSEEAKQVTGEGSGIGLWIVKGIMDAHRGTLLINPTTVENKTEVRLIFPF